MLPVTRYCALAALILSTIASSQSAGSAEPEDASISVQLSNFRFTPDMIELVHGQPYVLELTNIAGGGHNFVAKTFFAAAAVDPADQGKVKDGAVDVPGKQTVAIHLTAPAAGSFEVHCSHFMHSSFGMKGTIHVA